MQTFAYVAIDFTCGFIERVCFQCDKKITFNSFFGFRQIISFGILPILNTQQKAGMGILENEEQVPRILQVFAEIVYFSIIGTR